MKRAIAVACGLWLALVAAPANAQDRPAIWSGFYIGAHAGANGVSVDRERTLGGVSSSSANSSGAVFGLYTGANFQSGAWVYGLEADGNWNCHDSACLYSARGRLGYATGKWLLYGTAGVAAREEHLTWINNVTGVRTKQSDSVVGFIGGVGAEYQFAKNWAARAEVLYAPLADASFTSPNGAVKVKQSEDWVIGRLGISFLFN